MNDDTFAFLRKRNQKANLNGLESAVNSLVHMATQKTGGQNRSDNKNDIPFELLDLIKWQIICEATALVLDERFDDFKSYFEHGESIPISWLKKWDPGAYEDVGYQVMQKIIADWEWGKRKISDYE